MRKYNQKTKLWDVSVLDNGLLKPVGSFPDKESASQYGKHMDGVFKGFWKDDREEYRGIKTRFIKKAEADLKYDEETGMYPVLVWCKGKVYEMGEYKDRKIAWKIKREAEIQLKNINSNKL